jgi:hypothetical protein
MADGKCKRWGNNSGTSKHLAKINGETLLARTVRLLRENGAKDIIITTHNPAYETPGARLHQPLNNTREIDRFTEELIGDDICFLYGDTYYCSDTIEQIIAAPTSRMLFFGNHKSIIAIKIARADIFLNALNRVKQSINRGELIDGKGWQVYRAHQNLPYNSNDIVDDFIVVDSANCDINTPNDYAKLMEGETAYERVSC